MSKEKRRTFTVFSLTIDLDPKMRRRREEYIRAIQSSERWLSVLAEETGGWQKQASTNEIINQGEEIARRIGAQYIVSYTPKRPLALATEGEYRRVNVISRRVGLYVRARRGYLVTVEK